MKEIPKERPTPGSEEAAKLGCACPTIDNHYGDGFPGPEGKLFWIAEDCKIHGNKPEC